MESVVNFNVLQYYIRIVKATTANYTAMDDEDEMLPGEDSEEEEEEEDEEEEEEICDIPHGVEEGWEAEMFGVPLWESELLEEQLDWQVNSPIL